MELRIVLSGMLIVLIPVFGFAQGHGHGHGHGRGHDHGHGHPPPRVVQGYPRNPYIYIETIEAGRLEYMKGGLLSIRATDVEADYPHGRPLMATEPGNTYIFLTIVSFMIRTAAVTPTGITTAGSSAPLYQDTWLA